MKLGEKITMLRKQRNLSQGDLAKAVGVSRDAIGKYERGDIIPTVEKAQKIAETLNVTLDFLVSAAEKEDVLDHETLERVKEIQKLPPAERDKIVSVIDAFVRDIKTKMAYKIAQ